MKRVHPLRAYRESHVPPLSRRALAEQLGVDRITIWRWENDRRKPDRELLPKVTKLTGIPVETLMGLGE